MRFQAFGFGKQTGVELPGEDPGRLNPLAKWNKYSTESVAQGYELMVTPLQLARGFCAYANGGTTRPAAYRQRGARSRGQTSSTGRAARLTMMLKPLTRSLQRSLKRILCDMVVRGTATKARSRTGTSSARPEPRTSARASGGYNDNKYTSSFMGSAPAENPRLVITMVIHEPDIAFANEHGLSHYGGAVAAPGAGRVLERSLAYLRVPASPDLPIPPPQIANVLYAFDAKLYTNRSASAQE